MTYIQTLKREQWSDMLKLAGVSKDNIEETRFTFFDDTAIGPIAMTKLEHPLLIFRSYDELKEFQSEWDSIKEELCRS